MLQVGEYERAVEDYSQAVQVDPHNSYAYYNRGITRDRSGDYEGAITDFSHAIDLDPANADFFHNRGFSLKWLVHNSQSKCQNMGLAVKNSMQDSWCLCCMCHTLHRLLCF